MSAPGDVPFSDDEDEREAERPAEAAPEEDAEDTPTPAPTPSLRSRPVASPDRPWPLDLAREKGTDPHMKLERAYEEAKVAKIEREEKAVSDKKKKARKPWYITAASIAGTLVSTALGGSFFHSRGAHETAEKTNKIVETSNDSLSRRADDEQREREKLDKKLGTTQRDVMKLQVEMELLLDANHVPKSKRPKDEEE